MEEQKKPKMLYYSDSPLATTGLGRLTRYLLPKFAEIFDITQVATNHHWLSITPNGLYATYDRDLYKWEIIPTANKNDLHGNEVMKRLLNSVKYDVIFTSCDLNVVMPFFDDIQRHKATFNSKWISYTPIDRMHVLEGEQDIFTSADACVILSKYGQNLLRAKTNKKIHCIYHPLDLSEFPIISDEERLKFRRTFFKNWKDDAFIIGNVNRNQFRKDLARTMFAFNEYSKQNPKAKLYLHTSKDDDGGDISQNITEMGLELNDIAVPDIKDPATALPQEYLNKIYQSMNCIVSTSKGEGWGFTTIEAMACKIPVVVPNNTSFTEQIGDNERGLLADCNEWVIDYSISNCMRSLTDTKSLIEKINEVYTKPEQAKERAEIAYRWVKNKLNLNKIHAEWVELFKELQII